MSQDPWASPAFDDPPPGTMSNVALFMGIGSMVFGFGVFFLSFCTFGLTGILVPLAPVVSLVSACVAGVSLLQPDGRRGRRRAITGLVLSIVSGVIPFLFMALLALVVMLDSAGQL